MTSVWRSPRCSVGDHVLELRGGLLGVAEGAHRGGVAVRAEAGRRGEVQLGSGRVDEVVVLELLALAAALGRGVHDVDVGRAALAVPLRVKRDRLGLAERDALLGVHRCEREGHLVGIHAADSDPDVGRDPVPLGVGGHDHDLVLAAEQLAQVLRCGVAGDSGSQYDDACHVSSAVRIDDPNIPLGVLLRTGSVARRSTDRPPRSRVGGPHAGRFSVVPLNAPVLSFRVRKPISVPCEQACRSCSPRTPPPGSAR